MSKMPTVLDLYFAWIKLSEIYDSNESRLEDEDPNDPYNCIDELKEEQESLSRMMIWLDGLHSTAKKIERLFETDPI